MLRPFHFIFKIYILYFIYPLISETEAKYPAGQHVYPFSISLPSTVPSSFEGRRGYIRYQCMAFVDRGWKGMLDCEQDFTVIRHLDLNLLHNVAVSQYFIFGFSRNYFFLSICHFFLCMLNIWQKE